MDIDICELIYLDTHYLQFKLRQTILTINAFTEEDPNQESKSSSFILYIT